MKKIALITLSIVLTMYVPAKAFLTSTSSTATTTKSVTTKAQVTTKQKQTTAITTKAQVATKQKQTTAVADTQQRQHARRYAMAPRPEENYHLDAFDAKRPDGPYDWQPDAAAVAKNKELKKTKANRSIFNAVTN